MSVYYLTAATQPAFSVATRSGDYVTSYPLGAREPTARVVTAPFMQLSASYQRPDLLSICPDDTQLVFVDDRNFRDLGGGVSQWERVWASVPARYIDAQEYAYTFPAYAATISGSPVTISAVSAVSYGQATVFKITATLSGVSQGDTIYLWVSYNVAGSFGGTATFAGYTRVLAISGSDYTVSAQPAYSFGSFSSGSVHTATQGRATARSYTVPSQLVHEFFLTDRPESIVIPELFSPIDSTGAVVSTLSASSVPTSAQYSAMAGAGTALTVGVQLRVYQGPIWERVTRTVAAR